MSVLQLSLSDDVKTDGVQVSGPTFLHGPQGIAEQSSALPQEAAEIFLNGYGNSAEVFRIKG